MKAYDATMNQYFAIHKVSTEAANVIAISSVAHWFTSSPYGGRDGMKRATDIATWEATVAATRRVTDTATRVAIQIICQEATVAAIDEATRAATREGLMDDIGGEAA